MIEAKVNDKNIASRNLLHKLGFLEEAELRNRRMDLITGERCNLVIYSITKDEYKQKKDAI